MASPLRQLDWNLLRLFYFMCQSPSLTQAAIHLNTTQSSLSRRLADLEFRLGYRLFNRGVKGLTLREEGKELLEIVSQVFHKLMSYQTRQAQNNQTAQGVLRVLIAPHLPVSWLMQQTSQFLEAYPELNFSLIQHPSPQGQGSQPADCAIQLFDPTRTDEWIQRPLCRLSYGLYISQHYQDQKGPFEKIGHLNPHPKLLLKTPGSDKPFGWPDALGHDPKAARIHEFSTAQDLLEATRQGLGVAALPRQQGTEYSDLVALPFYIKDPVIDLYYAYPRYYQELKRVTLYGDFLEQHLDPYAEISLNNFIPVSEFILATG